MVEEGDRTGRDNPRRGLSPTARSLTDSTQMAGIKPAIQGVACSTNRKFLDGDSDDMTDETKGGGGQITSPTGSETGKGQTYLGRREQAPPP